MFLSLQRDATVLQLKSFFARTFAIPVEHQLVVLERPHTHTHLGRMLWQRDKPLTQLDVCTGSRIYVEYCSDPDDVSYMPRSKALIEERRQRTAAK